MIWKMSISCRPKSQKSREGREKRRQIFCLLTPGHALMPIFPTPPGHTPLPTVTTDASPSSGADATAVTPGIVRNTIVYALRGTPLSKNGFYAVMQLTPKTVTSFTTEVFMSKGFCIPDEKRDQRRIGRFGLQRIIVKAFLFSCGHDHGLANQVGRHTKGDKRGVVPPVGYSKPNVCNAYITA